MKLIDRIKAPEPKFWSIVMKWSLMILGGCVFVLGAEQAMTAWLPEFSFTLHPWASIIFKNLAVASGAVSLMAKLAVKDEN